MAQRRPITSHPAFAPFLALWFAALFGLVIAVLPAPLLERVLGSVGANALIPLTAAARLTAAGAAATAGALFGLALGLPLARRGRGDPRPFYTEPDLAAEHPVADHPVRRPLSVREELAGDLPGDMAMPAQLGEPMGFAQGAAASPGARTAEAEEGFMILTPQPVHPPRPAPDLGSLLEQFDSALAAFKSEESEDRPARGPGDPDPVHAFVARQTGAPAPGPAPSPLGGPMPDHQAELRAALDKLARAHRKDD